VLLQNRNLDKLTEGPGLYFLITRFCCPHATHQSLHFLLRTAFILCGTDSFTQPEKCAFASSTSLEKEVLPPVLRAFVVSRSLPVPGRCKSCYLGILRLSADSGSVCVQRSKILRRPLGSGIAIGIYSTVVNTRTRLRK
jgi:hypothetical protein